MKRVTFFFIFAMFAAASLTASSGTSSAPIGQVDAPMQNIQGVQGGIAVTGWAVDDSGAPSVKLYRNCLTASESTGCQSGIVPGMPAVSVVYLGDAAFVPGARPDVEAAFVSYPEVSRSAWGIEIVTILLPRTVGDFSPYGGQGPIILFAIASDVEGNRTLLGRTWNQDHTPTQIWMDNDHIAKPFGAIESPGNGATVSGMTPIIGWALTPDDFAAVFISPPGSTMRVFVDGKPLDQVAYNQCFGHVGNPVPFGLYCDDDVSNIFGNAEPQPPFTPRTSNPTPFRNLDAGLGPHGTFVLDTSTLPNGVHGLAWSVTDSANRLSAIGSRTIVVSNVSAKSKRSQPASQPDGRASDRSGFETPADQIGVRTGWKTDAPFTTVQEVNQQFDVTVTAGDRLELALPVAPTSAAWTGYLVSHGALTPLPAGSSVESRNKVYWHVLPGYLGTFDLLFLRPTQGGQTQSLSIRVTVQPS